ncbi:septation protein SepH [Aestuariimicrobium soli]|uniref:septation protein SepH n=1 Tax=Aestuariimicrobium soli TaxID=2035834 RepID=UPI003EB7CBF1
MSADHRGLVRASRHAPVPRQDVPHQDALEIPMESALSPRDIQTRIRSGESLDEVAAAAGVPAEKVEVFAAPVLAEREHVAGSAQQAPVRRTGESSSARALKAVIAERLQQRGIDVDDVVWDAWREPDRSWTIVVRYQSGSADHEGRFRFDPRARFSVARNDEARWLIGEVTSKHGPQPGRQPARRPNDPDHEPTVDLNDELALVRAVQPTGPTAAAAETRVQGTSSDEPDDYSEAELQEVDGVYDIVPQQSELDVLYEMLSSFNEDSVNIYAGLTQPVVDEIMASDEPPAPDATTDSDNDSSGELSLPHGQPEGMEQDPLIDSVLLERSEVEAGDPQSTEVEPEPTEATEVPDPPKKTTRPRTRKKSGRASVPSWDEIMFGGPKES